MIFSDESKFNIAGCDGSRNVFRKNNTRYDQNHMIFTEKFGGGKSVMVWGCLTSRGVGKLIFLEKM